MVRTVKGGRLPRSAHLSASPCCHAAGNLVRSATGPVRLEAAYDDCVVLALRQSLPNSPGSCAYCSRSPHRRRRKPSIDTRMQIAPPWSALCVLALTGLMACAPTPDPLMSYGFGNAVLISECSGMAPWSGPSYVCTKALHCTVVAESCCNQVFTADCSCSEGGTYTCSEGGDQCMGAQFMCSPGCDPWHFRFEGNCTPCSTLGGKYTQALNAALAKDNTCTSDADCGAISVAACASPCQLPVRLGQEASLSAAAVAAKAAYCPQSQGDTSCFGGGPCQTGTPRCVQGQCRLVQPCTPGLEPVGSPCTDSNACTEGEQCTAPFKCSGGKPMACDDGSPCTKDSCNAVSGCVHTPVQGACALPSAVCLISGQCTAGICQPSAFPGQAWDLPAKVGELVDVDVDATGEAAVLFHSSDETSVLVVRRVSGDGATLWQWSPGMSAWSGRAVSAGDDGGAAVLLRQGAANWSVVRLGADGQPLWQSPAAPIANSLQYQSIAVGSAGVAVASAVPKGDDRYLILDTWNLSGSKLGSKELASAGIKDAPHVAPATDGGYWLAAAGQSGAKESNIRIFRVSPANQLLVEEALAPSAQNIITALAGLDDGGALVAVQRIEYVGIEKIAVSELWRVSPGGDLVSVTPTDLFTADLAGSAASLRAAGFFTKDYGVYWCGSLVPGAAPTMDLSTPPGLWPLVGPRLAATPGQAAFWAIGKTADGQAVRLLRIGACP